MRNIRSLVLPLVVASACLACSTTPAERASRGSIPEVSVDEVARTLEAGQVVPVDANSASTRTSQGTLPNARLLSSCEQYDVATELPGDKAAKLVFYCGGTQCTASDKAAERAVAAGYTDVSIMRAGIRGWRDAGKPTQTPRG